MVQCLTIAAIQSSNNTNQSSLSCKMHCLPIPALPPSFHSPSLLADLPLLTATPLYHALYAMPKGVMQHNHLQCNYDEQLIMKIVEDERMWCQGGELVVGAAGEGRVSMGEVRGEKGEQGWRKWVLGKFMFLPEEQLLHAGKATAWVEFESRIQSFLPLLWHQHIFEHYLRHVFTKYARNNYQRVEFRAYLTELTVVDQSGNAIGKTDKRKYTQIVDQCVSEVAQQYPGFEVGIICNGVKVFSDEDNLKYFREVLSLGWDRIVGIDFVNEEDPNGSLQRYDRIVNQLQQQGLGRHIPKVYHAGESTSPANHNIALALDAGSVRIGHGVNLSLHPHLIPRCSGTCFQVNPISNLFLGYCPEPKQGHANKLAQWGIPFTINPDDPGLFGYADGTLDYFVAVVAYGWGLEMLSKVVQDSIRYALCGAGEKEKMMGEFQARWQKWLKQLENQAY